MKGDERQYCKRERERKDDYYLYKVLFNESKGYGIKFFFFSQRSKKVMRLFFDKSRRSICYVCVC